MIATRQVEFAESELLSATKSRLTVSSLFWKASMARLSRTETSLNQIANWILDRVIDPGAGEAANA